MKRDVVLALVLGTLAILAAIGLVAFQRTDRDATAHGGRMGRASRAKAERQVTEVNGLRVSRGRRFYYPRGHIVGYELHPNASLPAVPNEPQAPLEPWELQSPWIEIGGVK